MQTIHTQTIHGPPPAAASANAGQLTTKLTSKGPPFATDCALLARGFSFCLSPGKQTVEMFPEWPMSLTSWLHIPERGNFHMAHFRLMRLAGRSKFRWEPHRACDSRASSGPRFFQPACELSEHLARDNVSIANLMISLSISFQRPQLLLMSSASPNVPCGMAAARIGISLPETMAGAVE